MYTQTKFAKQHTHKYFVDSFTNDAICLCGKVRGSKKAVAGKYNAIRTIYNGYPYDSKFEAAKAMELDWLLRAKQIKGWDRQFPIEIRGGKERELIRRHKVDFRVRHLDNGFELIETKGFETGEYRLLKRLIEVLWLPKNKKYRYTLVK